MLVSDGVYQRIPTIWLTLGFALLILGLLAGPDYHLFWGMLLLGLLCLLRGVQIQRTRKSILNKTRVMVLTRTQKLQAEQAAESGR